MHISELQTTERFCGGEPAFHRWPWTKAEAWLKQIMAFKNGNPNHIAIRSTGKI
jgi:hypothetical protein